MLLCVVLAGMVWRQPHRRATIEISSSTTGDEESEGESETLEKALSSDFEDMVATRRRNYTSGDSVQGQPPHDGGKAPHSLTQGQPPPHDAIQGEPPHDGGKAPHSSTQGMPPHDAVQGQSLHDGGKGLGYPDDAEYQVLRRDWDWEERRLRVHQASNRFKRAYICLRPSCQDDLGVPESFPRLEGLNHHRVTKHAGASVIYTDKRVARERVEKFTNAPVRSTKDKNITNIYMKQHRLKISAGIQFQAYLQSTCAEHEEGWAKQKFTFIESYIEQGMRDYRARKEGKKVMRCESIVESRSCVICLGGFSHFSPMDTKDIDCVGKSSKEASIIDISSSDSEHKPNVRDDANDNVEDKHNDHVVDDPNVNVGDEPIDMGDGGLDEPIDMGDRGLDEHARDFASPMVSATVHEDDETINNLCDNFTHSLPRSKKGGQIRLVNYSTSEDESDPLNPTRPPTDMSLDQTQQGTRGYNTRFGGLSQLNYADTKRRPRVKRG